MRADVRLSQAEIVAPALSTSCGDELPGGNLEEPDYEGEGIGPPGHLLPGRPWPAASSPDS